MSPLVSTRPEWAALVAHAESVRDVHLRALFADDPGRGERCTLEAAGLLLDYSKHRVTDETLRLLLDLARAVDLPGARERMFTGERINATEGRAVLHTALRAPRDAALEVDGEDILKGDIFEKAEERAEAGVLKPRESADFSLRFNLYGSVPDVDRYDVVVTNVLDYKGK